MQYYVLQYTHNLLYIHLNILGFFFFFKHQRERHTVFCTGLTPVQPSDAAGNIPAKFNILPLSFSDCTVRAASDTARTKSCETYSTHERVETLKLWCPSNKKRGYRLFSFFIFKLKTNEVLFFLPQCILRAGCFASFLSPQQSSLNVFA